MKIELNDEEKEYLITALKLNNYCELALSENKIHKAIVGQTAKEKCEANMKIIESLLTKLGVK